MQRPFGWIALSFLALSATACSALTEPEEITISAEPIRSPNAPAPVQAVAERPGGLQMPAAAGGEKKGG